MADSSELRFVLFRLGPSVWAAPAAEVREVVAAGRPTRIPGAGETVAGLVNLRGTLLTVVDARLAVGVPDPEPRPESILVVEWNERAYGLLIDEMLDLLEIAGRDLVRDRRAPGIDRRLVRATGRHRARDFLVLDTEAVLRPVIG
jgi:purine-binding chemotaxis protein CheW